PRASIRAAIRPWTVSGRGRASAWRARPGPPASSRPRSVSMRTYSSAYRGLPPARSSSGAWSSAGSTLVSSRAASSRAVSASGSGPTWTRSVLDRPPQPGRRGPGGPDPPQGHVSGPVDQVLDEVQEGVVGPVEVLEHEHGRPLGGERLQ